ncbi:nuclear transport factor 2 family protein [Mucilaginibacter celer]|uniref:Nuclear transport factor 2 family protein n=1 Tax=Mucilaginibacter celer TaxID=2305508 RepID=A0A494VMN3_9SPHI|nr:nuclear transport factor 2 family protein [Mucilaginibacter celer]AYL95379.1 nuclear transport factor 2 family protein [Mucilaginibacter celer]
MSAITKYAYSTISCEEDKLKLGNQFLLAFRDRDWNLLRSIITEDCTWCLPGEGELAGESEGADEVIDKAKQFAKKLSLELDHIQYSLNCVALAIQNRSLSKEPTADEHIATVNTIRDGRISGIYTFFSDVPGMRTYFDGVAH